MKKQAENKDFLYFLNGNYLVSMHLIERLDELKDLPAFSDTQTVIAASISLLEQQVNRIDDLFTLMGEENLIAQYEPIINFLESAFSLIFSGNNKAPNLLLLYYVSIADAVMKETSKLAQLSLNHLPLEDRPEFHLYEVKTLGQLKASLQKVLMFP
jgi:hypothetical protein